MAGPSYRPFYDAELQRIAERGIADLDAGYDEAAAIRAGLGPDETGHWPSRDPATGRILKRPGHPTFDKTLAGEAEAGYRMYQDPGGELYSFPEAEGPPAGMAAYPDPGAFADAVFAEIEPRPPEPPPPPMTTRNPLTAFAAGLGARGTASGDVMRLTGAGRLLTAGAKAIQPGGPSFQEFTETDPEGIAANVAHGVGSLAGRLPYYAMGGAIVRKPLQAGLGYAVRRGVPQALATHAARALGMAGAFGLGDVASEAGAQLTEGEFDPGAIARAGGTGAAMGAALYPATLVRQPVARVLAESGALTGVGAAIGGQMPSWEDALTNLAVVGVLHGARVLPGMGEGGRPADLRGAWRSIVQGWKAGRAMEVAQKDPETLQAFLGGLEQAQAGDTRYLALLWDFMDPRLRTRHQGALKNLDRAHESGNPERVSLAESTLDAIESEVAQAVGQFRADYQGALDAQARRAGQPTGAGEPTGARGRFDAAPLTEEYQRLWSELRTGTPDPNRAAEIDRRMRDLAEKLRGFGVDPTQVEPGFGGGEEAMRHQVWPLYTAEGNVLPGTETPPAGPQQTRLGGAYHETRPGLYGPTGRPITAAEMPAQSTGAERIARAAAEALDRIYGEQVMGGVRGYRGPRITPQPKPPKAETGFEMREPESAQADEQAARTWAAAWESGKTKREGGEGRAAARRWAGASGLGWTQAQIRNMPTAMLARIIRKGIRPQDEPALAARLRGGKKPPDEPPPPPPGAAPPPSGKSPRRPPPPPPGAAPVPGDQPLPPAEPRAPADLPQGEPGPRWIMDTGTMPGEPTWFLDSFGERAKASIRELETTGGRAARYQVLDREGLQVGITTTLAEAAKLAEEHFPESKPRPTPTPPAPAPGPAGRTRFPDLKPKERAAARRSEMEAEDRVRSMARKGRTVPQDSPRWGEMVSRVELYARNSGLPEPAWRKILEEEGIRAKPPAPEKPKPPAGKPQAFTGITEATPLPVTEEHLAELRREREAMEAKKGKPKPLPATYSGEQKGGKAPIQLWTLTKDVAGLKAGTTRSATALRKLGLDVPEPTAEQRAEAERFRAEQQARADAARKPPTRERVVRTRAKVSMPEHPRSNLSGMARYIREQGGISDPAFKESYPDVPMLYQKGGDTIDGWAERLAGERPDLWKSRTEAFEWLQDEFSAGDRQGRSKRGRMSVEEEAAEQERDWIQTNVDRLKAAADKQGVDLSDQKARNALMQQEGLRQVPPEELQPGEVYYIPERDDIFRVTRTGKGELRLEDGTALPVNDFTFYSAIKLGESTKTTPGAPGAEAPTMAEAAESIEEARVAREAREATEREIEAGRERAGRTGQASLLDVGATQRAMFEAEGRAREAEARGRQTTIPIERPDPRTYVLLDKRTKQVKSTPLTQSEAIAAAQKDRTIAVVNFKDRRSMERYLEQQKNPGTTASSEEPLLPDEPPPRSIGAAAARDFPKYRNVTLRQQAQASGAQFPAPGKPEALTPERLAEVTSQIARVEKLFGRGAGKDLRAWLRASKELTAREQGRVQGKRRQREGKATLSDLERTAVPIPAEGRPVSDAERVILMRGGKVDEQKAAKLGTPGRIRSYEDFKALSEPERLVHLTRDVRGAKHHRHIDNILTSKKYRIWELPKDDIEALMAVVGERFRGMDFRGGDLPAETARLVQAVGKGDTPGIASEQPIGKTEYVWGWLPARSALRNVGFGILEHPEMGMRGAESVRRAEWDTKVHAAEKVIFRDAKDRKIRKQSRDSAIIHALVDNWEGDKAYIDRESVTMPDTDPYHRSPKWTKGEKIKVEEYHRRAARLWIEELEDLADRMGLRDEMRRTYYAPHTGPSEFLGRILDLKPATEKDFARIHKLAESKLKEGEYHPGRLTDLLPENMSRARALQIMDALRGYKAATTFRSLRYKVRTVLLTSEEGNVPKELRHPHLKRREGLPWVSDAISSYEAYLRYSLRKIHIEPAIEAILPVIEQMGEARGGFGVGVGRISKRAYAEEWLKQIAGKPTGAEQRIDAYLEHLAMRTGRLSQLPITRWIFEPRAGTRAAHAINRYQYYRLLGLALDSALTNLSQGVNIWARFGLPRTAAAYMRLLGNPRNLPFLFGSRKLRFKGKTLKFDPQAEFREFATGPDPRQIVKAPGTFLERATLSPFTFAENVNRGAAMLAGLAEAKAKGMSFDKSLKLGQAHVSRFVEKYLPDHFKDTFYTSEAEWFARQGVMETQGAYSAVESSPLFRSPGRKVAFQFFNYPTQQLAFIADGMAGKIEPGAWARLRFLALLGATAGGIDQVMKRVYGVDVSQLWSIRGILPRGPGPNALAALWVMGALGGDWAAKARLKQEYGTPKTSPIQVPLAGMWIPRGARKALGISHRNLDEAPGIYRYIPARPVEQESGGREREGRGTRESRGGR